MFTMPGGAARGKGKNTEAAEAFPARFLLPAVWGSGLWRYRGPRAWGGLLDTRCQPSHARQDPAVIRRLGADFREDAPSITENDLITAPAMAPVILHSPFSNAARSMRRRCWKPGTG